MCSQHLPRIAIKIKRFDEKEEDEEGEEESEKKTDSNACKAPMRWATAKKSHNDAVKVCISGEMNEATETTA